MCHNGIGWNSFALGSIIKCCASGSGGGDDVEGRIAEAVHGCVVEAGLDADLFLASSMIDMYAKRGALVNAVTLTGPKCDCFQCVDCRILS